MASIASGLAASSVRRLLFVGSLAILAALIAIPRVAGQESSTLEFDITLNRDSIEVAKALGNPLDPAVLGRGDVRSAQGVVSVDGERIGTFYLLAIVTFETQYFATAANHVHIQGTIELFGEGSLTVTGVASFTNPFHVAITGGTGAYSGAGGQCSVTSAAGVDRWVCEVR